MTAPRDYLLSVTFYRSLVSLKTRKVIWICSHDGHCASLSAFGAQLIISESVDEDIQYKFAEDSHLLVFYQ